MRHFLLVLFVAIAFSSCDFTENELPEDNYMVYCYTLADEFNQGGHHLSEYFDLQLFSDKVSGQMNEYLGRRLHIANGYSFAPYIDTFLTGVDLLAFNKLKRDKQGRLKAVFYTHIYGEQSYMEMELSQNSHKISIADIYDYTSGAYLSELIGQGMALANGYSEYHNGKATLSYNPYTIYNDLITSLAIKNMKLGWESYNQLKSKERDLEVFDFFRVTLALNSADSIYYSTIDAMLSEKKRDPRFFYTHRFAYFSLKKDYAQALEQLKKLHEYTGTTATEISQLGVYSALAGKHKEAFKYSKELKELAPESMVPEMQNLLTFYLMGDSVNFFGQMIALRKEQSLSPDELWWELSDQYLMVNDPEYDKMASWVLLDAPIDLD